MNKATKVDAMTWSYRGFTISRNYVSCHGTGRLCDSQQGVAVTPSVSYGSSSGIHGKWQPSVRTAVENIDDLYSRYSSLPSRIRAVVDEAASIACERGESVECPVQHLCRHGIDN